jgi:hypothetical protein
MQRYASCLYIKFGLIPLPYLKISKTIYDLNPEKGKKKVDLTGSDRSCMYYWEKRKINGYELSRPFPHVLLLKVVSMEETQGISKCRR